MGVNNQEMPTTTLFDEDLKKPASNQGKLNISKRNLCFVAFAVIVLQGFDTAVLWLSGAKSSDSFSGDSFMFSAVIFGILKCTYDKYFKSVKAPEEEQEEVADEVEEDYRQSATTVVDTMKFKPPSRVVIPPRKTRHAKTPSMGSEVTIWVSSWLRAPALNPKAQKFSPLCAHLGASTLDSGAPVFVPQATANKEAQLLQCAYMKEAQLLKSESGGADAGAVVYRSKHWMNEVGYQEVGSSLSEPVVLKKNKSPELRASKSPEPVVLTKNSATKAKKVWQPVAKVMWPVAMSI